MKPEQIATIMFERLEAAGCEFVVRDDTLLIRAGDRDRGFIAAHKKLCVKMYRERLAGKPWPKPDNPPQPPPDDDDIPFGGDDAR